MLHQPHAGELKIGLASFPVHQAAFEGRQLLEILAVDPIPGRLLDPAAAFLKCAAGTKAEVTFCLL